MGRVAACVSIVLGACFSPSPPTGSPCLDGVCPSELVCSQTTQTCEKPGSGGAVDAPINPNDDAAIDAFVAPDGLACFGTGTVTVCPSMPVTQPLSIQNATTFDTDTSPSCLAYTGTPGFCLLAGTTVTIGRTVRAQGAKPLLVLSLDTLTVSGMGGGIDVASTLGSTAGAGANPAACVAGTAATGQQGGPGGSFGGVGGRGADLESVNGPPAAPSVAFPLMTVRGGCKGGNGAGGNASVGGNGGGALVLIAKTSITISGLVNASGAAGNGTVGRAGGAGGGSGGMIVLDAPSVTVQTNGRVMANGGGGGEGGTNNQSGDPGTNPINPLVGASGGTNGSPHGGSGGAGSAGTTRNANGGDLGNQCGGAGGENGKGGGGGGGGGSAGVIRIFAATKSIANNTMSPPDN